jgi:uncharacterized OsmC-like protein
MPKIKAKATWIENVHSKVDNQRNHSVECDLSTAAGGTDCGPTALELSLMALADCGITIFADVCKKSNIKLKKVEVTAEADKSPDSPIISNVSLKSKRLFRCQKRVAGSGLEKNRSKLPSPIHIQRANTGKGRI